MLGLADAPDAGAYPVLQLIIDPACSVVFEAEPLEDDAMTTPPRDRNQRLFRRDVVARGLWQGAGLLVLLLMVYVYVWSVNDSDGEARAVTFMVLVLSNLGLIHANRSWSRASWRGTAAPNRQFGWITLAHAGLARLRAGHYRGRSAFRLRATDSCHARGGYRHGHSEPGLVPVRPTGIRPTSQGSQSGPGCCVGTRVLCAY